MHLIVGLGNPGREYENTRHNLGFMIVDNIANTLGCEFHPGTGEYWQAICSFKNHEAVLIKPTTFMNNSGIALLDLGENEEIQYTDIMVVCDDFQLPLGSLRLRPQGSDGGHNGLASVIYHLQTDQFPRLRCGIASEFMPKERSSMADFVLEPFAPQEQQRLESMLDRARDAVLSYLENGIERTMNQFNIHDEEIF